ncbi:hypothetical protein ACX0G9_22980 [Flavitalea flava]
MHKAFMFIGCAVLLSVVSYGQSLKNGDGTGTEIKWKRDLVKAETNFPSGMTVPPWIQPSLTVSLEPLSNMAPFSGITQTCLSTHVFNDCSTSGFITFGFNPSSAAGTSSSDPLTIQQSNLSIGVNVNNPLAKLHIKGDGITGTSSSFLVNNNGNAELFRILDNGNVGIGISNPQTMLAVNGTVSAKKIKVTQSGWPDYVFDKKYKLPSLKELERFINKNKHLPGIASEEEVKRDGLDIGDTQNILLKKIEELTLYVIQQNKELAQVKEKNRKLELQQDRLDKQQKEIDELKEMIRNQVNRN